MVVCDWNDCLNTFNTSDAIKLLNAEELSVSFWLPILVFMSLKTPPQMIAKKRAPVSRRPFVVSISKPINLPRAD